jgi:hypothetical protein
MTNKYITISDSQANLVRRCAVIKMQTPWQNTSEFKITAGGKLDKAAGVILELFRFTLKIYAEPETNYASLDDLKTFFLLNNPTPLAGASSDLLTLTDHFGTNHNVKFRGDAAPEPVTTQLSGPNALYYVNVEFIKVDIAEGS